MRSEASNVICGRSAIDPASCTAATAKIDSLSVGKVSLSSMRSWRCLFSIASLSATGKSAPLFQVAVYGF